MKRRDDAGAAGRGGAPIDPEFLDDLAAQLEPDADVIAQLAAAREEAAANLETAKRWQADFENFRKRQAAQAEEQALRASERVVERLIPALDDLERAIDHTTAGGDLEDLLKGVEMVHEKILGALAKEGVESIDPFGEEFDPNVHQAVGQREDDEVPDNTVVEVVHKGFRLHGKVLRPAAVVVSTGGRDRGRSGTGHARGPSA